METFLLLPFAFQLAFLVLSFILGAVIGSFLNVVIIRIPIHEPITGLTNRSHCMSCGKQLSNIDLIPIFSYIFLGGKCRFCHERISPRYWIVELTTAVMYTLSTLFLGISISLPIAFVLIASLIVASGIDIDRMEIPHGCSIVIAGLGVIATIISVFTKDMPWYDHLIGAAAVAVPFALLMMFGAMGGGDVILMAASGLLLGWKNIIVAAAVGIVLGAVGGSIELLGVPKALKQKAREKTAEIAERWYEAQKEAGAYILPGKSDVVYGSIFKGRSDIEAGCIDEKCWSKAPDINALNSMLDSELSDVSKFGVSIVIENDEKSENPENKGKISKINCKKQIVFGPYLSVGIAMAYLLGNRMIEVYMSLF